MTQRVSVGAQLALASTVIAGMVAIWWFGRGLFARWGFLALGSMVVMRYIFWRATYTLPPLDQPINFTIGLVLIIAQLLRADPDDRPHHQCRPVGPQTAGARGRCRAADRRRLHPT